LKWRREDDDNNDDEDNEDEHHANDSTMSSRAARMERLASERRAQRQRQQQRHEQEQEQSIGVSNSSSTRRRGGAWWWSSGYQYQHQQQQYYCYDTLSRRCMETMPMNIISGRSTTLSSRNNNDNDDDDDNNLDGVVDDDVDDDDIDYAVADDPEEDEEGEDLLENAERDYQRIEALDTYGTEGIDETDYGAMDMEERMAAEKELERRDRFGERGDAHGRLPGRNGTQLDDDAALEDDEARRQRRAHSDTMQDQDEDAEDEEEDVDADDQINLEAFDVPLREWIAQDRTRKEVSRKFRAFLKNFTPQAPLTKKNNGMGYYEVKIRTMCANNLQDAASLRHSFDMEVEPVLAFWIIDAPKDMSKS
jgi:hypothetical protein